MRTFISIILYFACHLISEGQSVSYDLTNDERTLALAGQERWVLTINSGIPEPILRFRQGDDIGIVVQNNLSSEETSLHWHGLLVPNAQDGVPYLTTPPIKPGKSHTFQFPLTHNGTYWYHSHIGLQEQRGVYASIVVTPRGVEPDRVDRDYVLVLSDWTNERPKEVMRTLMRGSEWYGIEKGNAQSILGTYRAGALGDYFDREKSSMAAMDISDVAYDAFLINGKQTSTLKAQPGERIRLRLVNAGASTYFYVHFATGRLIIVATDGPSVRPKKVDKLLIGMAENYDVIVTVPRSGSWEIRATAKDNSGHASVFLGDGTAREVDSIPSPNLYSMDHMLMAAMGDADQMAMSVRPDAPYSHLRARQSTRPSKKHPVRAITLRLTGDMTRYLWSFNGNTLAEDSTIPITKGEVLRVKLINDTMMHHPLHLHGHFFRLLNGQGACAPLKHTVDVPPMGTREIEFLANEEGDWFFHCHLLYHMDAGMARVFSYRKAEDPEYEPSLDPKLLLPWFFMIDGMLHNHMIMGRATVISGRENLSLLWDYGFHHHREYEIDLLWSHYFGPNLSTDLGYRITNDHLAEDRAVAGIRYRLPYLIESELSLDSEGDLRAGLGKELQLTQRLSLYGDVEYDTNTQWQYRVGINYQLNKQFGLSAAYHSEHGCGGGLSFSS